MATKKKSKAVGNVVAKNRKARHDYFIVETIEAGIMLLGTEVKSLREGRASIGEAFAAELNGVITLQNAYIPDYPNAAFKHEPRAPRKLLLHKREISKLLAAQQRKGMSLIPLAIYFNDRGYAKVELALAEGKKAHDKRQSSKESDWKRDQARVMRDRG